jgi:hypothetical protein
MVNNVSVLAPNVFDINSQLEIKNLILEAIKTASIGLDDNSPKEKWGDYFKYLTANFVYDFICEAPMYRTWDEIRVRFKDILALQVDSAIKYLLQTKAIKEDYLRT